MERIVQKLNSPLLKRKSLADGNRSFGVPLKSLFYKKSSSVPRIVENICEFLLTFGSHTEGIFRVNGSAKAIASLKAQFDVTCAGDISNAGCVDIHAICGVFKLFLREIPEGLIPDAATRQTVKIMDQLKDDKPQCLLKLRNVVTNLPEENYNLLRYICHFLEELASNEASTKMSAANLGIVFGPCLFKCGLGVQGLRQQNLSNLATTCFITHFETIFSPATSVHSSEQQFGLLKSAASLNSLLQRRRHDVSRRSIAPAASTEEAMAEGVEGGLCSRTISPWGDSASPLLSVPVGNSSNIASHSTNSLLLSPSRKWLYSDAEEIELRSHGALARELASIMTSISIPSVTKLNQLSDAAPTSNTIFTTVAMPSSVSTSEKEEEEDKVEVHRSPPSLPSLVHLYHHNQHHLPHHHHKYHVWRGQCGELEGKEKISSDSSSTTSLLEVAAALTFSQLLTESTTETTTHTLTVEEFEPAHAYLSSSIVDDMHSACPTSDAEEEDQADEEDVEEARENSSATTSSTHHFPRAKCRLPHVFSAPKQHHDSSCRLYHGVLNYLDYLSADAAFGEFRVLPSAEAIVCSIHPSDDYIPPLQPILPPRILIANPVCQSITPRPRHILTWPRKRNILSRLRNRRSLDVYIPLTGRPNGEETTAFSNASKVRLVEPSSSLDISLPDPIHLEVAGFLTVLQAVLETRRKECRRPEDVEHMSLAELAQEKLDLQKCLLYFEKMKGRPSDPITKRVMKPIYDRYRCVRRLVRLASNSAIRFSRGRSSGSAPQPSVDSVRTLMGIAVVEPTQTDEVVKFAETEPIITLESSLTPEALLGTSSTNFSQTETDQTASFMSNGAESLPSFFLNWELTLLEFIQFAMNVDPGELTRGRAEILSVKHKLQRFLHDYEKRIQEVTNHPPSKRDRDGLRSEYNRYRDCKQRLYVIDRLVEEPQTNLESLIVDAQSVGRAHRRRKVVESAVGKDETIQQKVSTTIKTATPMLQSQDSASCT
ncbi:Protein FAM13A [Echinococcus granulosus]|uniref:Rho GTPase-activating protein 22 n=1 Tax=Echinococcus granulosus TaxID=6210 RepID=U6JGS2_ECHGR|nr:Rho GTPase-activating protein 22 [Echinococcus granulosus]EUB61449.1 Rho GTPase-activating protein 22 [Echinococcus granulosus]KAH9284705.1 Protein FAM13A [Echinococcus granulosus]CDS23252.1 RhoGAP [Echinococcus granulosus]